MLVGVWKRDVSTCPGSNPWHPGGTEEWEGPASGSFHQPPGSCTVPLQCSFAPTCSLNPACISKPLRLLLNSPPPLWNVYLCAILYTSHYVYLCVRNSLCCINTGHNFQDSYSVTVCKRFPCGYPCTCLQTEIGVGQPG